MSARQVRNLHKQYCASLPKWRRPLVGYICAIPILLLSLFIAVWLQQVLQRFLFPGTFLLLPVLLVSLAWGVGPALLMLVIGIIALDYYFVPLVGQFLLRNGDILQIIPVFIIGLVILLIVGQRERAYIKLLAVDRELERYAGELEEVNNHLENEKREKESFLSIASHELKTPVTTIHVYSQLLQRRLAKRSTLTDIPDLEPTFKRIEEQTAKLTILIDQLLDVNILRSQGAPLHKTHYDLNQLCRKVIEDEQILTSRDIVFSPYSESLELLIDVDRMTQVLINLVNNALKYSPQDKPVQVCVDRDKQCALLQVQDYGCGIASDKLPQIFNMFYRTPEARTSTTSGLGLGLAISKEIVERHGGRIWCESELGVGSTFFVALPLP